MISKDNFNKGFYKDFFLLKQRNLKYFSTGCPKSQEFSGHGLPDDFLSKGQITTVLHYMSILSKQTNSHHSRMYSIEINIHKIMIEYYLLI